VSLHFPVERQGRAHDSYHQRYYTLFCCFRLPFQSVTGLRAFTLPPTFSTSYPQRRSQPPHHILLFSAPLPPTSTFASSGVLATRTPLLLLPITSPRSYRCVFLGYSSDHKGYQCLDLTMNRPLIFQHVVFDKSSFPFASSDPPPDDLDSLLTWTPPSRQSCGSRHCSTLPFFCCRYLRDCRHATRGPGTPARSTRGPGAPA
jgi:hypothetical protein